MRYWKSAYWSLAIACAAALGVARAEETVAPHISVVGSAVIQTTPDKMYWKLHVQTKGKVPAEIAKAHGITVDRVLSIIRKAGVGDRDLQTEVLRFMEDTDFVNGSRHVKVGYVATTDVQFSITEFRLYETLWNQLAAEPGVSISHTTLSSSRDSEARSEARKQAAVAAREKAKALASALGASIGDPITIQESEWFTEGIGNFQRPNLAEDQSVPMFAPGSLPVHAKVKATFRLITSGK